jgi:copper transport protein
VSGYARWAVWAFALTLASGTVAAVALVPAEALTTTSYGRWLLVKTALVAVAAGAAVAARRGLRRDRPATTRAASRVEVIALALVLTVTATLVSTPTARDAQSVPPSPPQGLVLPAATLAGQVGVAVAASQGQVVVRLTAPRVDNYYQARPVQPYRLAARYYRTGGGDRELTLRRCGEGCFAATVDWATGPNLLTLAVAADGWRGGTVTLLLPWPIRDAGPRLTRVAATLRKASMITIYESVSSDTTASAGTVVPIRMAGARFLATEPYSSGQAPQVVESNAGNGTTTLALGYPADGRYVQLTVDRHDRIRSEIVVDPKHLARRSFVYPAGGS